MSVDDLDKLRLNQQVTVKRNNNTEASYVGTVQMIDNWKKRVGVVNRFGNYREYPPRLILNDL